MFESIQGNDKRAAGTRLGASAVISFVIYGGIAAGVVAASTVAKSAIDRENLVQVEFARVPEPVAPPPAPEPPPPAAQPRQAPPPRGVPRPRLEQPRALPTERPQESDRELAPSSDTNGEGIGDPNGVPGGTGTAPVAVPAPPPAPEPPPRPRGPVQLPESATPPEPLADNAPPAYPEAARASGLQVTVIAKIVVREDGSVGAVEILRGDPAFDDEVRRTLRTWRFRPATLDGEPIAVFRVIRVPFRLDNL